MKYRGAAAVARPRVLCIPFREREGCENACAHAAAAVDRYLRSLRQFALIRALPASFSLIPYLYALHTSAFPLAAAAVCYCGSFSLFFSSFAARAAAATTALVAHFPAKPLYVLLTPFLLV